VKSARQLIEDDDDFPDPSVLIQDVYGYQEILKGLGFSRKPSWRYHKWEYVYGGRIHVEVVKDPEKPAFQIKVYDSARTFNAQMFVNLEGLKRLLTEIKDTLREKALPHSNLWDKETLDAINRVITSHSAFKPEYYYELAYKDSDGDDRTIFYTDYDGATADYFNMQIRPGFVRPRLYRVDAYGNKAEINVMKYHQHPSSFF